MELWLKYFFLLSSAVLFKTIGKYRKTKMDKYKNTDFNIIHNFKGVLYRVSIGECAAHAYNAYNTKYHENIDIEFDSDIFQILFSATKVNLM